APTVVAAAPSPAPRPPDAAAIKALEDRLVHVAPVEQGSNLLIIDFAAIAPKLTDSDVGALLTPLREHIADLSLARAPIGDGVMELVATMPTLRSLNRTATKITDAGVTRLAGLPKLEELVLAQTAVTDAAAADLKKLQALKHVYVWGSALSTETLADLRAH